MCVGLAACASPHQKSARPDAIGANPVTVVAFGDMLYRTEDTTAYEALLRSISAEAPDVTINVGDIK